MAVTIDGTSGISVSGNNISPLLSGGALATTSGTSFDYIIPAGVKRITMMLNGVSTNGTSALLVQIGSGSIANTGYNGQAWTSTGSGVITSGMPLTTASAAAAAVNSVAVLTLLSGNTWSYFALTGVANSTNNGYHAVGFSGPLSGVLDRIRLTTVNGTDTFDAGSVNILYE